MNDADPSNNPPDAWTEVLNADELDKIHARLTEEFGGDVDDDGSPSNS